MQNVELKIGDTLTHKRTKIEWTIRDIRFNYLYDVKIKKYLVCYLYDVKIKKYLVCYDIETYTQTNLLKDFYTQQQIRKLKLEQLR